MPYELRKNFIVANENGMNGSTPFGYARTYSGVVKAMDEMNQMGTRIQRTMKRATR
jgi:hypothetical protein